MALWVNAIFGRPATVELHILQIVQHDLGLGDAPVITDPTVIQMTYSKSVNWFTQTRMHQLINTAFPNQIVVTGVDNTYGFMNGPFWVNITDNGGAVTRLVTSGKQCLGDAPVYTTDNIQVVYDVTEAGGAGYWVRDAANNKVVEPPPVTLFHELSHAYHWANRSSQFCVSGEWQAVSDENEIRKQFSLPSRSLKNLEAGIGAPSPYNPWEGIGCFIVTAITGSPRSAQVLQFHRIRDTLLRPTAIGRALFANIFAEYYQCAPQIVVDMQADSRIMLLVTKLVVEPLLDLLLLAQRHAQCDLRCGSLDGNVQELLQATLGRLDSLGIARTDLCGLVGSVSAMHTILAGSSKSSILATVESDPRSIFEYLASIIITRSPKHSFLGWAIARPLLIYWGAVAHFSSERHAIELLRGLLADNIEDWIAAAPVDWNFVVSDSAMLTNDLRVLAEQVVPNEMVRSRLATEILELVSPSTGQRLMQAAQAAGFASS